MSNARPFRFQELPKEIRLIVYEYLPINVTHHAFQLSEPPPENGSALPLLERVRKTISGVSILATCREINSEAGAILQPKLNSLRREPMRFKASLDALSSNFLRELLYICRSAGIEQAQHVHIAIIRDPCVDLEEAFFMLRMNIYRALSGVKYRRYLLVQVRPALLSPEETVDWDEKWPGLSLGFCPSIYGGEGIDSAEWQKDWAEGGRSE